MQFDTTPPFVALLKLNRDHFQLINNEISRSLRAQCKTPLNRDRVADQLIRSSNRIVTILEPTRRGPAQSCTPPARHGRR